MTPLWCWLVGPLFSILNLFCMVSDSILHIISKIRTIFGILAERIEHFNTQNKYLWF